MNKGILILVMMLVVVSWIVCPILIHCLIPDFEKASQISDTFNIVNSLYSGLGFAAILYTINIQQAEIKNEIVTVSKSNRLSYLTTLLSFYSAEEEKYRGIDESKRNESKIRKERILTLINLEIDYDTKI